MMTMKNIRNENNPLSGAELLAYMQTCDYYQDQEYEKHNCSFERIRKAVPEKNVFTKFYLFIARLKSAMEFLGLDFIYPHLFHVHNDGQKFIEGSWQVGNQILAISFDYLTDMVFFALSFDGISKKFQVRREDEIDESIIDIVYGFIKLSKIKDRFLAETETTRKKIREGSEKWH